jgi:CBS domain-containing protein
MTKRKPKAASVAWIESMENQHPDSGTDLNLGTATARDLMVPNPLSIQDQATVKDAILFLTRNGFTAAPVIDETGRPVGVVSQTNIVLHARDRIDALPSVPDYYNKANLAAPSQEAAPGESLTGDGGRILVRDIMTPTIFAVAPDTPAREVVERMRALMVHRLFVVDDKGALVGVISALDVLRHVR